MGLLFLQAVQNVDIPIMAAYLLMVSLIVGVRTVTEETTSFEVIPLRYRIIVNAFGREHQFTDARTVALADRIVKVQLVSQFNAWGVLLEQGNQAPRLELVLKEAP